MANIRQTILVREDLNLPRGLLASQCSHLHFEKFRKHLLGDGTQPALSDGVMDWLQSPYIFIHGVPNKEVLQYFMSIAKTRDVVYTPWVDTIFMNVSESQRIALSDVFIGIAFDPTDSDVIKSIIGDLPLLK